MTLAPAPVVLRYERRAALRVIAEAESKLRIAELGGERLGVRATESLESWANTLELALLVASVHDAVWQLDLRTLADAFRESDRLDALVQTLSRLDLRAVVERNEERFRPYTRYSFHATEPITVDLPMMLRSMQSLVLHCPICDLEQTGRELGLPELAHRCRLAYDGVRAFIARRSRPQSGAATTAGRLYAEGRASVDEVATMLGMDVPDVLVLLEEQGFRRSMDAIRLSEEQRRKKLGAIRRDRIARDSEPESSPSQIAREVIASQRIEGIDARSWPRP